MITHDTNPEVTFLCKLNGILREAKVSMGSLWIKTQSGEWQHIAFAEKTEEELRR